MTKRILVLFAMLVVISCVSKGFNELYSEGMNDAKYGRYEWAIDTLQKAENIDPKNKFLLSDISYVYFKMGKMKESIEYSDKVLSQDIGYYRAYRRKALSYRKLKEYEKSIQSLEKLLELDPKDAGAIYIIAKNYYDLKSFSKCIDTIKQFRELVAKLRNDQPSEKQKNYLQGLEREIDSMETVIKKYYESKT